MAQTKQTRNKKKPPPPPPAELRELFETPGWGPTFEAVQNMVTPSVGRARARGTSARWGICWGDAEFPIFFQLLVNGQYVPPPLHGEDGAVDVPIVLKEGANRLDWDIRHTGQGWKNQVWIQVGTRAPVLLKADSDPSASDGADISSGSNVRVSV